MKKSHYQASLRALQIELVRFQRRLIESNLQVLVLFEGRDAAGKDGTIKRITEHMSPRETRVVALGKPSDRDISAWYFQRFVAQLPLAQEMVLFNRSWYNRAGVERVMGFCTEDQYQAFLGDVCPFEKLLLDSGIKLFKYYLDITKHEQMRRLEARRRSPLKQWKSSPIDAAAIEYWDQYSEARNDMLAATSTAQAPWTVVLADDKRETRVNVLRHLLKRLHDSYQAGVIEPVDTDIVFEYSAATAKRLAH